jgi:hypothetical protein
MSVQASMHSLTSIECVGNFYGKDSVIHYEHHRSRSALLVTKQIEKRRLNKESISLLSNQLGRERDTEKFNLPIEQTQSRAPPTTSS